MAEREYKNMLGETVSLDKLCHQSPQWAANSIRRLEAEVDGLQKRVLSGPERLSALKWYDERDAFKKKLREALHFNDLDTAFKKTLREALHFNDLDTASEEWVDAAYALAEMSVRCHICSELFPPSMIQDKHCQGCHGG